MNKTKETLAQEAQEALACKPQLPQAQMSNTEQNSRVRLVVTADEKEQKTEAENRDQPPKSKPIPDELLAHRILKVLKSAYWIPDQNIKIKVDSGWVTLEGPVHWNFQKQAAQDLVAQLTGVRGISNHIQTPSESENERQKKVIEEAIKSNAALENNLIEIQVQGPEVTLSGMTKSFFEKQEAERIIWQMPGVWNVINNLGVDSF